jgi:GT2 family glycosyltransferase
VVIVTTQLLRDVGGFDEAIDSGEDIDLWMRLALRSPACIVGESLARIRHHAGDRKREASRSYASRDYSLRKLTEGATAAQRALLERELSLNALVWAVETAARGGRWRALAMVGKSLPFGWKFPLWWYESAKALVRACLLPSRGRSRSGVNG